MGSMELGLTEGESFRMTWRDSAGIPNPPKSPERSNPEQQVGSGIQGPTLCYFMVVDILGFSQIVTNLSGKEQTERITDWIQLVETTRVETGISQTQLISDTLFAREADSADGLARMIQFARLLLERGLAANFPLRGSIVHGEAAWGKLTYGDAVIKAHKLERSLEWIGIACEPSLPRLDRMWDWDKVVVYLVPTKHGNVETMAAVSWEVPEGDELPRRAGSKGLLADGMSIPWASVTKWERTAQFAIYLRAGRLAGWDPGRWHGGWHPAFFVDSIMNALANDAVQTTIDTEMST